MSPLLTISLILAAIVIMVRCLCIVSKLSARTWIGHRLKFAALAAAYSLIAGGAIGSMLHWPMGPAFLMYGVAGLVLFDRRRA